ncbi:hypothetical protein FB45DRAFT_214233 [Roridomyces roridus]|uniref:Uncharacterized protein n=1 Tax=Roridomyces roridus TaxID=1738132 RepID=A0AAD7BDP9_9AGAR|nr:hypothetical protein FB45DRAFT_214233 [Roridomyces roridus]
MCHLCKRPGALMALLGVPRVQGDAVTRHRIMIRDHVLITSSFFLFIPAAPNSSPLSGAWLLDLVPLCSYTGPAGAEPPVDIPDSRLLLAY